RAVKSIPTTPTARKTGTRRALGPRRERGMVPHARRACRGVARLPEQAPLPARRARRRAHRRGRVDAGTAQRARPGVAASPAARDVGDLPRRRGRVVRALPLPPLRGAVSLDVARREPALARVPPLRLREVARPSSRARLRTDRERPLSPAGAPPTAQRLVSAARWPRVRMARRSDPTSATER